MAHCLACYLSHWVKNVPWAKMTNQLTPGLAVFPVNVFLKILLHTSIPIACYSQNKHQLCCNTETLVLSSRLLKYLKWLQLKYTRSGKWSMKTKLPSRKFRQVWRSALTVLHSHFFLSFFLFESRNFHISSLHKECGGSVQDFGVTFPGFKSLLCHI